MNVLIISSWYPNSKNNISGIFVKEQVKALSMVGIKPIVFYPYDTSIKKRKINVGFEEGIKTYRANSDYIKNTKISRINSLIYTLKFLKRIIKVDSIDLIHSHVCYPSGFAAAYNKRFNGTPYIITEHMSYIKSYSEKKYNRYLFNYSYGNAEKVIPVSKYLNNELLEIGFKFEGEVIGNVVKVAEYFPIKRERKSNEFNILFIGLMDETEIKGLQFFIPALANYIKHNPQYTIKFNLVGDGIEKEKYIELCKKLDIYSKCNFYGALPKEEIPQIISENDFLVLPSLKETFGTVLIEAMAMGKPVLSTMCGGPNEFVNEEVGILVTPGSIEELEYGLEKIIMSYDKFDSNNIRNYVIENFSYDAIGNKLIKIYQSILEKWE